MEGTRLINRLSRPRHAGPQMAETTLLHAQPDYTKPAKVVAQKTLRNHKIRVLEEP